MSNSSIWDFRSYYDEVDTLPLMSSAVPMAAITTFYLAFVLKIGPSIMQNREPFKLKNCLLVYNAFQVVISFILVYKAYGYLRAHGVIPTKCFADDEAMRKTALSLIWFYLIAKVSELLDTIFFVLRQKFGQVSFLHVYHHTLMMVGTWAFLKYFPHDNMITIGLVNSAVHVVMYTYYGLAALPGMAKHLWWKEYITVLQLIQFAIAFVYYQVSGFVSECPPSKPTILLMTINNFLFVYLFGKFYYNSYVKNRGHKSVNDAAFTKENGIAKKDDQRSGTAFTKQNGIAKKND